MTKENFEGLKESIIEAGKIMRGEIKPSREFIYELTLRGKNYLFLSPTATNFIAQRESLG